MSKISDKMQKLRERRKAAPPVTPKKIKIKKEEATVLPVVQENDSHFPVGLLASIVLFIFFGAKYGIKR